jgi:propionate kinase
MDIATPNSNDAILTINSGSSTVRFALFADREPIGRILSGTVDHVGTGRATLTVVEADGRRHDVNDPGLARATDRAAAATALVEWLDTRSARTSIAAVGHRVVHGGPDHGRQELVTPILLDELRRLVPFAPNHLPAELDLIDLCGRSYPGVPQVACFDTAFHHDLPTVARTFPIPRRFSERGVRRYGFHGLSYTYLLAELGRVAGPIAAGGKVILAHLGNGSSLAAVRGGRCIDTSMGFTPTGGLMMGTRSGDLDPGLLSYLAREGSLSAAELDDLTSRRSGLLGVSDTTADVRALLAIEAADPRAGEAIALFCYQVRKGIGAFAAALGGLDTLVFAGGIGENAFPIRERICENLGYLGLRIDASRNAANAAVIAADVSQVVVRVIPTDEEVTIAEAVHSLTAGRSSPGRAGDRGRVDGEPV